MKKIFIIILFAAAAFGFTGGDGTEENPFGISTPDDLKAMAGNLSARYILLNDIDMYGIAFDGIALDWNRPFAGVFKGNGKVIKNLTIKSAAAAHLASLFGIISERGAVDNLGLSNVRIESSNARFAGGIAGWNKGLIENCFVTGNILAFSTAGGIVGGMNERGTIRNCFTYCAVGAVDEIAGGIAGEVSGGAMIENCVSYGNVYAQGWAGGISGRCTEQASIKACLYNNDFTRWSPAGKALSAAQPWLFSEAGEEFGFFAKSEQSGAVWKKNAAEFFIKDAPILSWVDEKYIVTPFANNIFVPKSIVQTDIFEPGALWPDSQNSHINSHDGAITAYDGKYYWFGQRWTENYTGDLCWTGVNCYSSRDLYNWEYDGFALAVPDDSQSDIAKGCKIQRPFVAYNQNSGKFVMWFNLVPKNGGQGDTKTAVAYADDIKGPYKYLYSFRPNANFWPQNATEQMKQLSDDNRLSRDFVGGQSACDSAMFVDDDGKAYQIYAAEGNSLLHISLLSDDYLRPSGQYVRIENIKAVHSPCVFKNDGKYYIITNKSAGLVYDESVAYVADSMWGTWYEIGNPCDGEGSDKTFYSIGKCVMPIASMPGKFIFIAERYMPHNAIESRYVWLQMSFIKGAPVVRWNKQWDFSIFDESRDVRKKLVF